MRKIVQSFFMLMLLTTMAWAQEKTVTGIVTAKDDGLPIPGASVKVKGTTQGTQTDANGKFSLKVTGENAVLVISFIGSATQEVKVSATNTVSVVLLDDKTQLGEVVVTALGGNKEKRTLGYSTATIKAEDITKSAPVSLFDGLQGKIAGVNITSQSGAPGASTKVILRGYTSIGGNNQPLYVVDGVPVNNTSFGEKNDVLNTRSTDFGNNSNDINPNDIETIDILKGAGATSLYGSRAANGVIIITTKKGKSGTINVDFTSSATLSSVLFLPKLQNKFGQGWSGSFDSKENGSWGPRFTGENRLWGNVVDNSQLVKPFSAQPNNIRDFYDIGSEINNNIAISGGSEASQFYLSYGNIGSNGIIPTKSDSYNRNTISLRGSTKYKNFTASASLNYVSKHSSFVTTGQATSAGATIFQELIQIPRDHSIVDSKDYKNKFYNTNNYFTPYAQNPYQVLNENGNSFNSERIYGNVNLDYKFTHWFSSTIRIGSDVTNARLKDWQAISDPEDGSPNSSRTPDVGGLNEQSNYLNETNADLILNFKTKITSDIKFDGLLGGNFNQREARDLETSILGLTIPKFYNLSNSAEPPKAKTLNTKRRLMGGYAQANFGFKDYLFLSLSARNDWSSTLPKGKNAFFYPAANLSFVLSDAVKELSDYKISFAKIRASIGKTGNDADPYLLNSILVPGDVILGFGNIKFPLSTVNAFELGNRIGNPNLKPELTTEYEVGTDLRFFQNRLGIDFSFYHRRTDGQILNVPIAATSGYTTFTTNFGLVQNQGIELSLNGTPVKSSSFAWDINYVFSRNRNKVLALPAGLDQVIINSGYDVDFVAIKGQPLGVFKGPTEKTDPNGNIIVNKTNGLPKQADNKVEYGNSQRDYTMGLTNSFKYKNFRLGASFDYRKGGLFWSYTSQLNYFVGNSQQTTYNDRNPYIIPNSVNETEVNGNMVYTENTTPISYSDLNIYHSSGDNTQSVSRRTVLDKTSLRMRDLTLSYTLPKSVSKRIRASNIMLTAYGRNLFLWVPAANTFIDPDASTYNNDLRGELGEFAAGPSTRSYGLLLKASF